MCKSEFLSKFRGKLSAMETLLGQVLSGMYCPSMLGVVTVQPSATVLVHLGTKVHILRRNSGFEMPTVKIRGVLFSPYHLVQVRRSCYVGGHSVPVTAGSHMAVISVSTPAQSK